MKKILRVVGDSQYVEYVECYMGEIEKVILTRDPKEAYDWTIKMDPEYYGVAVDQLAAWVESETDYLLEIVEVL